jgi:hypothetical protein
MTALLPFLLLATAPTAVPAPVANDSVAHPLRVAVLSRVDYRFTSRFAFGASLAYANLKGKDERVHNVLPEVSTEYRVPLRKEAFGMPLRLSLGFLPKNGPTLRLGAGIDFAFSDTVSCEVIPLEPMVWLTRERPEVSLNASIALRVAF